ncbi:MAG: hypothetical protein IPK59_20290 [Rhodospirillaceae bacterium]|nr:hypothetical protein [Rhodospirillaceae bacterium]
MPGTEVPAQFIPARNILADAIARAEKSALPASAITSALLVEILPRLVAEFGHQKCAFLLNKLADEVLADATGPGNAH